MIKKAYLLYIKWDGEHYCWHGVCYAKSRSAARAIGANELVNVAGDMFWDEAVRDVAAYRAPSLDKWRPDETMIEFSDMCVFDLIELQNRGIHYNPRLHICDARKKRDIKSLHQTINGRAVLAAIRDAGERQVGCCYDGDDDRSPVHRAMEMKYNLGDVHLR